MTVLLRIGPAAAGASAGLLKALRHEAPGPDTTAKRLSGHQYPSALCLQDQPWRLGGAAGAELGARRDDIPEVRAARSRPQATSTAGPRLGACSPSRARKPPRLRTPALRAKSSRSPRPTRSRPASGCRRWTIPRQIGVELSQTARNATVAIRPRPIARMMSGWPARLPGWPRKKAR